MPSTTPYRGRRAVAIENRWLRVTVLEGGGHIAEVLDKASGVNPLWTPIWPSIEPWDFDARRDQAVYGRGAEARLLGSIMGHNVCLDIFGGPSADEAASGLGVHGEAPVARWDLDADGDVLRAAASLPSARLHIERQLTLHDRSVHVREVVRNEARHDRPIAWTQHVTLGPPFLERGATKFRASATRSRTFETTFGTSDYLAPAVNFDWPHAPTLDGRSVDLRTFTNAAVSGAFTTHAMDLDQPDAFFVAFSPRVELAFGYVWRRADFPWLGIWEENCSRLGPPWNGGTITRGMEFGVSPFPETRRAMIERGSLFDTPSYRWIPGGASLEVEYWIVLNASDKIPETLSPTIDL